MNKLRISICMPVYNGEGWIGPTLECLLRQSFRDYEMVIVDDGSTDDTCAVVESYGNPRIRLFRAEHRGYSSTLRQCVREAENEIVLYMGCDDFVSDNMLQQIHDIFVEHPNVGAVTRAYYWYAGNIRHAVRVKPPVSASGDVILSIKEAPPEQVHRAFHSMDQLSGLAFRREWMDVPIHDHIFTAHVYPMASIFKKHDIYCIHDNTIAVQIESSQCRKLSWIYDPSPMATWAELFETVYSEPEFKDVRQHCIRDFVARNYLGLVQIRNFGKYSWLLREIGYLIKYRWQNLFSLQFWFFSLGCMVLPPALLLPMVDTYKLRFASKAIGSVEFNYTEPEDRRQED